MQLLVLGSAVLLVLYFIKKIYIKYWSKGITTKIELSESTAYPGDKLTLTEVVENRKWLPLPMIKVKFEVDKSFIFDDLVVNTNISDKCYKSDVFSLLFYQKITRKLPFVCTKRGYFSINSMDVVSTDILMDKVLATVFPVGQHLMVYPQPLDATDVDIPFNNIMGTLLTRRFAYEDPFEFRGIREYQTYDTMKDVNWTASAKTGDLKVNIHNYTASQQVCILLNLENEGIWEYEVLKEKSISMACSLANLLTAQGVGVSIISNGVDKLTGEAFITGSGSDEGHRMTIASGLARIDLKKNMQDFAECINKNRGHIEDGDVLVLISTCKKDNLQKYYSELAIKHKGSLWIFPVHDGMDMEFREAVNIEILKWIIEM